LIHFDFDERYQDELVVGTPMSRRAGVLMSVVFHALIGAALLVAPQLPIFQTSAEELRLLEERRLAMRKPEERRTFVFVQPRVDLEAPRPPDRGEDSDKDRMARAPERAPNPLNSLPFARGNSSDRVEADEASPSRPRGPESTLPQPGEIPQPQPQETRRLPPADTGLSMPRETPNARVGGGALGEALRNLQRYVQRESFNNPQGGIDQPGATIQFDTKGVEFGPWIRRFVAQVKGNWFIPYAAMAMRGHVVLQFNVHKDGRISDIAVVKPSQIDGFNNAAYNAILTSNPTEPLPPEYPSDKAFFTVTFYYNEQPPGD
jgi:TonB family protein